MRQFDCAWLDLREPLDSASRAPGLAQALNRAKLKRPIQIVDLGSGTGANLRYLCQVLGDRQQWCLIDRDKTLLDAMTERMRDWAADRGVTVEQAGEELMIGGQGFECRARRLQIDLGTDLAAVRLPAGALVSSSALLDLVSESWLRTLGRRCLSVRATVLFALTYDGRMLFDPREPEDEFVRQLVNRHQTTNKGFGEALGPEAGHKAVQIFRELGYRVESAPSDWNIKPSERSIQEALLDNWLAAATEIAPEKMPRLRNWARQRRAHLAGGRSKLTIGHVDILALPT